MTMTACCSAARTGLILMLLALVITNVPLRAQDAALTPSPTTPAAAAPGEAEVADPSAGPAAGDDLETTEQTVKIDGSADDQEIAQRLQKILIAAERYQQLEVTVTDGIVFIDGRTTRGDFKDWASQLARRTQDVVAVINRIEVVPPVSLEQYQLKDQVLDIWRGLLRALPLIGLGLLILLISAGLARLVTAVLGWPLRQFTDSRLLRNVIRKVIGLMVILGGLVLFLRVSGLTDVALTVVSGTGLLGLILGFAFRDIAENFLASILLSVRTPFRLGDVIEVEGYTGVVQTVTPRGTVLVDFDGNHIQIANSTVYKATLKNLTANPNMRMHFDVGIGYDASVKQAQAVALQTLQEHPAVLNDPEPMVLVDNLGASTINLKVYFWIDGHRVSGLKVKSALMRRVVRAIEQRGISLPDESREIIFPQGVPVVSPPPLESSPEASSTEVAEDSPADAQAPQTPGSRGRKPVGPVGENDEPVNPPPSPDKTAATPSNEQKRIIHHDLSDDATPAEGDLSSEVADIRQQARDSRNPEEGPGIVD